MDRYAQPKPMRPTGKKTAITILGQGGNITVFLSHADDIVERHVTKVLASSTLRQTAVRKSRILRAPHLSTVERELAELKKIVEALAIRSIAQAQEARDDSFDMEGMTVLDADMAYQLLDNPPEPNEALRNLLALR